MRADLHIHSTASDGCWTPAQIIKGVSELGIHLFAVTDHDSIDNVLVTEQLSAVNSLSYIRGVEISSTYQGRLIHILGYDIDPTHPPLIKALKENRNRLDRGNDLDIQKLIEIGHPINYDDYLTFQYDETRGGWKSLNYLIDIGMCQGVADFFSNIRSQVGHISITFRNTGSVIELIRKAGGIPVLAHPGASLPGDTLIESMNQLRDLGLAGVECYAQYHDQTITELCVAWSKDNNMLITGGSDYHGGFVNRSLGIPLLDHERDLELGPIFPAHSHK